MHKIVFEEYPAATDLGARNLAALGALAQFFRVQAQERRRLLKVERLHRSEVADQARVNARPDAPQRYRHDWRPLRARWGRRRGRCRRAVGLDPAP